MVSSQLENTSVLGLWLFPISYPLQKITIEEKRWGNQFASKRKKENIHARSCARIALSDLFQIDPLQIPLNAPPGNAPQLAKGWGYLSISHCKNAVIIGWSNQKIGIDIENTNRELNIKSLKKFLLNKEEKDNFVNFMPNSIKNILLSKWVSKEAAIKWQGGKLFNEIRQWELKNNNLAIHNSRGYKLNIHIINYQSWIISIASEEKVNYQFPILCLHKI